MKLNKKGFTLIELMIVVAIIGILAAVAVPGFMKYIKDSKKSEARTNLDAIKTGAVSFYEAEHYDSTGLNSITKVYPSITGVYSTGGTATITLPGAAGTGTTAKVPATAVGVGSKTSPSDIATDIEKMPWSTLKFKISAPFYYQYQYISQYNATGEDLGAKFAAGALASLSESNDSAFHIIGTAEGVVGAIVEAVDGKQGTAPTFSIDGFALATGSGN